MKWQLSVLFPIIQLNVLDGLATILFQGNKNENFVPLSDSKCNCYKIPTFYFTYEKWGSERIKRVKVHVQTYSTAEPN